MDEVSRELLVKHRARLFANKIKANPGFAFTVDNDTIEWLKDSEVETFKAHLVTFGLRQRNRDFKWEKA